jgi:hypothetical protein
MANITTATVSLAVLLLITGCSTAKKASEVQAARVPVAPYLKLNCQELLAEQRVIVEKVGASQKAVETSHSSDKNVELVAWILFFPAAFALEGNQQQATDYALAKGQFEAIQDAMGINKCYSGDVPKPVLNASQIQPDPTSQSSSNVQAVSGAQPTAPARASIRTKDERLIELKRFFDAGLITNDAYLDQQKKILDSPT